MDSQKIISQTSKKVIDTFNKSVLPILDKPIVIVLISWLVIVNIIFSVEDFPETIKDVFKHKLTKTSIIFLGIFVATKDFYLSVLSTLVLYLFYYVIKMVPETFKLVWPETDTYPGCGDVKVSDLLALFDGSEEKLKRTMYSCGVPLNLELDDLNAPLIATYLINFGHKVTDNCRAPM